MVKGRRKKKKEEDDDGWEMRFTVVSDRRLENAGTAFFKVTTFHLCTPVVFSMRKYVRLAPKLCKPYGWIGMPIFA